MTDHPDLADDLLRGGDRIAEYLYADDYRRKPEATKKRTYTECTKGMWPTFTLPGSTVLLALKSQLREYALNRTRETEAKIAAAAMKPAIVKSVKPKRAVGKSVKPKRGRARTRKAA